MKNWVKGSFVFVVALAAVLVFLFVLLPLIYDDDGTRVYGDPPDHNIYFNAEYLAREGGYIVGDVSQRIKEGENAAPVTAVAYDGYEFIGWSDANATEEKREDILNRTRQDTALKYNVTQIAYFRTPQKTFTYNYNGATSDTSTKSVTFAYDENQFIPPDLVIPTKTGYEFGGWYLEQEYVTKAIDSNGTFMLGYHVFDTTLTSDNLYARWVAHSNEVVYKTLVVFVDELQASLKALDGNYIDVSYKMTGFERDVCSTIPFEIASYLNEWFDGIIKFEVDMYFTTQVITNDSMFAPSNSLFANEIPEVAHMILNYRSTLTTFSMNDYGGRLHDNSGIAGKKHGAVYLEGVVGRFYSGNHVNDVFELDRGNGLSNVNTYLHEFAHTVEDHYDYGEVIEYHDVLSIEYDRTHEEVKQMTFNELEALNEDIYLLNRLKATKLFLLGIYEIDGEKVGIPPSYWVGDVIIYVDYDNNGNYIHILGYEPIMLVDGVEHIASVRQEVLYGRDAKEVTVIPPKGCRFVGWSDGLTNHTRKDKNIREYMRLVAIFEPLDDVQVNYGDRIQTTTVNVIDKDTELRVWNFDTAEFELANPTSVSSNEAGLYDIVHLTFSDGTEFSLVAGEYAFYDNDLNAFVTIDEQILESVGHSYSKIYYKAAYGRFDLEQITLTTVRIEKNIYLKPLNIPKISEGLAYFANGIMAIPQENADQSNNQSIAHATLKITP